MKKYIKSKANPNAVGPGYRTPDHFKGSIFSGTKSIFSKRQTYSPKFNPSQFRTQHKGG